MRVCSHFNNRNICFTAKLLKQIYRYHKIRRTFLNSELIILNHSSNVTRKGPEFYTTNCCRSVYVGKIAQRISRIFIAQRIRCLEHGSVSCCLIDQKRILGLVSSHKVKKSVLTNTPPLGQ